MANNIPYPEPLDDPSKEIHRFLQRGALSGKHADHLLTAGIDWSVVAPHVQELSWWNAQIPHHAEPAKHSWSVEAWNTTICLKANGATIWIDPGKYAPWLKTEPDLIIVTHAHLDHIAKIYDWARVHSSSRIIMTSLTARLLEFRASTDPELDYWIQRAIKLEFNQPRVVNDICIQFMPAGHLIGAALVEIGMEGDKVLIASDFTLRRVGGLAGASIPSEQYGIMVMGVTEARLNSLPLADLETNHIKFLETVVNEIALDSSPLLISAQAFGQCQEAYSALVSAQRAGAFPRNDVYLSGLAAMVSALYAESIAEDSSVWCIPFETLTDAPPPNSIVIVPEQGRNVLNGKCKLIKPKIYTHASFGELMTMALGVEYYQLYLYQGFNSSLEKLLRNLGCLLYRPSTEEKNDSN